MAVVNQDQNQNNNNQQNQQDQQVMTGGGVSQTAQPSSQAQGPKSGSEGAKLGSGRFQNLSNYLKANQGAGQRMGQAIGTKVGGQVEKQKEETQKNLSQLASGIQAGKQEVQAGQGFNQQLQNIGQGLQGFQSMENRQAFDEAGQRAMQFAQQPEFSRFQNIQAGSAIDEANLRQQQATTAALQGQTQENIQKRLGQVSTEQGRFNLLRDVYGGKKYGQQYGAGNVRLDQLLLQNDPGKAVDSLRSQFGEQAKSVDSLGRQVSSTAEQNQRLIEDEANIVDQLNTQSRTNQDVFNQMLGKQENIDFINQLRQQKVDEYANALKNRQFSTDQAEFFNLSGGQYGTAGDQLRLYNVDTSNPYKYIQQAQLAQGMQDIATEQDYDAYKALQQIANRDTGKLSGASQLGAALQKQEGTNLGEDVRAQDAAFRNIVGQNQTYTYQGTGPSGGGGFRTFDPSYTMGGTLQNFLNRGRRGVDTVNNRQVAQNPARNTSGFENQMNALLSNLGYDKALGQIGLANSAATEKYKRFSRLV